MKNEALRLFAAAVGVDHLSFLNRRQGGESEGLGFSALENSRAVGAGNHSGFASDLPQILISAAVHPLLLFQNAFPERFLLDVIEGLRNREGIGLRMFFQD